MEHFANFFGRFHPVLVHLPIGSIILAFLFDALSLFRKYRRLRMAVQPALLFGGLSALLSAVTGYFLSLEGGYESETLMLHQYGGIATTLLSFALLYLRTNDSVLSFERTRRTPLRFFLFVPVVLLLTLTGHWGGSLTHGEEFITAFSFSSAEAKTDPITKIQSISKLDEAVLYTDVIQPILESKCYSCHSSTKQKGDLRLDSPELILEGGKDGHVLQAGVADSSSLFSRTMLPLEDDDHMPPNEKPQPSSAELDLIRLWINEGAQFDKKINELKDAGKAIQYANLLIESIQTKTWIPKNEVSAANESALKKLKNQGAVVLPLSENSNYIHVNFTNARDLSQEALESLSGVKDQLVSLRLSYCKLANPDLKFLNDFENLTWLFLDHTNVTDSSFQSIKALPSLKYLNAVFTQVSDKSFTKEKFPMLEQLFVFQTNVTKRGLEEILLKNPTVKLDTGGFVLPRLASDTIIHKKKS